MPQNPSGMRFRADIVNRSRAAKAEFLVSKGTPLGQIRLDRGRTGVIPLPGDTIRRDFNTHGTRINLPTDASMAVAPVALVRLLHVFATKRPRCGGRPGLAASGQPGGRVQMPIDTDDLEPLKKVPPKKDLDRMSVEELNDYIVEMEGEIARVREKIKTKQAHQAAAALFFKKP